MIQREDLIASFASGETRLALVGGGRLVELVIDRPDRPSLIGNVYLGRVLRTTPALAAAFVDCGLDRPAFLAAADAEPEGAEGRSRGIERLVHEGQAVIVQVSHDPVGDKAARVTRKISLAGFALRFLPAGAELRLSPRITDDGERVRLERAIAGCLAPGEGAVIRSAAIGQDQATLVAELARLRGQWHDLEARAANSVAPAKLAGDSDAFLRLLRERGARLERILVDAPDALHKARALADQLLPGLVARIAVHTGKDDLFEELGLESEIDAALARVLPLPGGGRLLFERTEALTAIDVDSGSVPGATAKTVRARQVNAEAVAAIARQLRLRNVAGLVVIDFLRLADKAGQRRLTGDLSEALANDPATIRLGGFTALGLFELTRQRIGPTLAEIMTEACDRCAGEGALIAVECVARAIARRLRAAARKQPTRRLRVRAAPEVAAALGALLRANATGQPTVAGIVGEIVADATRARDSFELVPL